MKKILLGAIALLLVGSMVFAGGKKDAAKEEVVEFYHGFFHSESEWPPAKAMRDIYDEFAARYADGPVKFKAIPLETRDDMASAQIAGGNFPDIVDLGRPLSPSAISQGLVMDLKPYIDSNNLKAAVGINYVQNSVNGGVYSVHDQVENRGIWYNEAILRKAGVSINDLGTWDGFAKAMEAVRNLNDGSYGYIAGQGSVMMLAAHMAQTESGRKLVASELTTDVINSKEFENSFKAIAAMDKANGSAHTTVDTGNLMADFNTAGKVAVLNNGAWNASSVSKDMIGTLKPAIYPGNVSISSAGYGITISNKMSEAKKKVALDFLAYMVSPEVQEKIFTLVQATPCNSNVDLNKLAAQTTDPNTALLADACSQINNAQIVVKSLYYSWGNDVVNSLINAFMECAVSATDINQRFNQLKQELTALIS